MAQHDIHVANHNGSGWTVKKPSDPQSKCYGNFRFRAHAEAFGRALAHRNRVALVVHLADGREARYQASSLSYPVQLS